MVNHPNRSRITAHTIHGAAISIRRELTQQPTVDWHLSPDENFSVVDGVRYRTVEAYAVYCGAPSPTNRRLTLSSMPAGGMFDSEADAVAWCEAHPRAVA